MFQLGSKCGEHRPDRFATDGDLSITRSDEDHIPSAKSQRRLKISPLKRSIEGGQRVPHGLRFGVHAHTLRRGLSVLQTEATRLPPSSHPRGIKDH